MRNHAAFCSLPLILILACADPGAPTMDPAQAGELVLTASAPTLTADGVSSIEIQATIQGVDDGFVVRFFTDGGMLSTDAAPLVKGVAKISLYAPTEEQLLDGRTTITIDAAVGLTMDIAKQHSLTVGVVEAVGGAASLSLSSDVELTRADGATTVTLTARGLRFDASQQVQFTASPADAIQFTAASVALVDGIATTTFTAPAAPVDVVVTATAGALSQSKTINFVGADEAAFDLEGEWVQMSWGAVELNGGIIDPARQCVAAAAFMHVSITREGDKLVTRSTTCHVEMPKVNILFFGESTTTTGPDFASAVPVKQAEYLVDGTDIGATVTVRPEDLAQVTIVGARNLTNPATDPLPTSSSDAHVFDADNDQKPGVTVVNSMKGEQHIVYRVTPIAFHGVVLSSSEIDGSSPGSVEGTTETSILDLDGVSGGFMPETAGLPSTFTIRRADDRFDGLDLGDRDGVAGFTCKDLDAAARLDLQATFAAPDLTPCGG